MPCCYHEVPFPQGDCPLCQALLYSLGGDALDNSDMSPYPCSANKTTKSGLG